MQAGSTVGPDIKALPTLRSHSGVILMMMDGKRNCFIGYWQIRKQTTQCNLEMKIRLIYFTDIFVL